MELRHFDKLFVKNTRKKAPQAKVLEHFPLDTPLLPLPPFRLSCAVARLIMYKDIFKHLAIAAYFLSRLLKIKMAK